MCLTIRPGVRLHLGTHPPAAEHAHSEAHTHHVDADAAWGPLFGTQSPRTTSPPHHHS